MKRILVTDNSLKIISVLIAICIWVYIALVMDPAIEVTVRDIPIQFTGQEILASKNLAVISESATTVTVKIKGSRKKMGNNDMDTIIAKADVQSANEGMITIPVEIVIPFENQGISSQSLYSVDVKVEPIAEKTFDVGTITSGSLAQSYMCGDITCNPQKVRVKGPESAIEQLSKAVVKLNFGGADVDIDTRLQSTFVLDTGDIRQMYVADATSTFETLVGSRGEIIIEPRANVSERTLTEASESYSDWLQLKTTIYYETGTYNTIGYIKLTKVSTTVSYIGGNVKANLLKLRHGYYGYNLDTERLMSGQYTSEWTSKSSVLNLSTNVTCPRLELTPGGIPYNVFGEASCTASRGGTTFTVSHSVREIDAPAPPYN